MSSRQENRGAKNRGRLNFTIYPPYPAKPRQNARPAKSQPKRKKPVPWTQDFRIDTKPNQYPNPKASSNGKVPFGRTTANDKLTDAVQRQTVSRQYGEKIRNRNRQLVKSNGQKGSRSKAKREAQSVEDANEVWGRLRDLTDRLEATIPALLRISETAIRSKIESNPSHEPMQVELPFSQPLAPASEPQHVSESQQLEPRSLPAFLIPRRSDGSQIDAMPSSPGREFPFAGPPNYQSHNSNWESRSTVDRETRGQPLQPFETNYADTSWGRREFIGSGSHTIGQGAGDYKSDWGHRSDMRPTNVRHPASQTDARVLHHTLNKESNYIAYQEPGRMNLTSIEKLWEPTAAARQPPPTSYRPWEQPAEAFPSPWAPRESYPEDNPSRLEGGNFWQNPEAKGGDPFSVINILISKRKESAMPCKEEPRHELPPKMEFQTQERDSRFFPSDDSLNNSRRDISLTNLHYSEDIKLSNGGGELPMDTTLREPNPENDSMYRTGIASSHQDPVQPNACTSNSTSVLEQHDVGKHGLEKNEDMCDPLISAVVDVVGNMVVEGGLKPSETQREVCEPAEQNEQSKLSPTSLHRALHREVEKLEVLSDMEIQLMELSNSRKLAVSQKEVVNMGRILEERERETENQLSNQQNALDELHEKSKSLTQMVYDEQVSRIQEMTDAFLQQMQQSTQRHSTCQTSPHDLNMAEELARSGEQKKGRSSYQGRDAANSPGVNVERSPHREDSAAHYHDVERMDGSGERVGGSRRGQIRSEGEVVDRGGCSGSDSLLNGDLRSSIVKRKHRELQSLKDRMTSVELEIQALLAYDDRVRDPGNELDVKGVHWTLPRTAHESIGGPHLASREANAKVSAETDNRGRVEAQYAAMNFQKTNHETKRSSREQEEERKPFNEAATKASPQRNITEQVAADLSAQRGDLAGTSGDWTRKATDVWVEGQMQDSVLTASGRQHLHAGLPEDLLPEPYEEAERTSHHHACSQNIKYDDRRCGDSEKPAGNAQSEEAEHGFEQEQPCEGQTSKLKPAPSHASCSSKDSWVIRSTTVGLPNEGQESLVAERSRNELDRQISQSSVVKKDRSIGESVFSNNSLSESFECHVGENMGIPTTEDVAYHLEVGSENQERGKTGNMEEVKDEDTTPVISEEINADSRETSCVHSAGLHDPIPSNVSAAARSVSDALGSECKTESMKVTKEDFPVEQHLPKLAMEDEYYRAEVRVSEASNLPGIELAVDSSLTRSGRIGEAVVINSSSSAKELSTQRSGDEKEMGEDSRGTISNASSYIDLVVDEDIPELSIQHSLPPNETAIQHSESIGEDIAGTERSISNVSGVVESEILGQYSVRSSDGSSSMYQNPDTRKEKETPGTSQINHPEGLKPATPHTEFGNGQDMISNASNGSSPKSIVESVLDTIDTSAMGNNEDWLPEPSERQDVQIEPQVSSQQNECLGQIGVQSAAPVDFRDEHVSVPQLSKQVSNTSLGSGYSLEWEAPDDQPMGVSIDGLQDRSAHDDRDTLIPQIDEATADVDSSRFETPNAEMTESQIGDAQGRFAAPIPGALADSGVKGRVAGLYIKKCEDQKAGTDMQSNDSCDAQLSTQRISTNPSIVDVNEAVGDHSSCSSHDSLPRIASTEDSKSSSPGPSVDGEGNIMGPASSLSSISEEISRESLTLSGGDSGSKDYEQHYQVGSTDEGIQSIALELQSVRKDQFNAAEAKGAQNTGDVLLEDITSVVHDVSASGLSDIKEADILHGIVNIETHEEVDDLGIIDDIQDSFDSIGRDMGVNASSLEPCTLGSEEEGVEPDDPIPAEDFLDVDLPNAKEETQELLRELGSGSKNESFGDGLASSSKQGGTSSSSASEVCSEALSMAEDMSVVGSDETCDFLTTSDINNTDPLRDADTIDKPNTHSDQEGPEKLDSTPDVQDGILSTTCGSGADRLGPDHQASGLVESSMEVSVSGSDLLRPLPPTTAPSQITQLDKDEAEGTPIVSIESPSVLTDPCEDSIDDGYVAGECSNMPVMEDEPEPQRLEELPSPTPPPFCEVEAAQDNWDAHEIQGTSASNSSLRGDPELGILERGPMGGGAEESDGVLVLDDCIELTTSEAGDKGWYGTFQNSACDTEPTPLSGSQDTKNDSDMVDSALGDIHSDFRQPNRPTVTDHGIEGPVDRERVAHNGSSLQQENDLVVAAGAASSPGMGDHEDRERGGGFMMESSDDSDAASISEEDYSSEWGDNSDDADYLVAIAPAVEDRHEDRLEGQSLTSESISSTLLRPNSAERRDVEEVSTSERETTQATVHARPLGQLPPLRGVIPAVKHSFSSSTDGVDGASENTVIGKEEENQMASKETEGGSSSCERGAADGDTAELEVHPRHISIMLEKDGSMSEAESIPEEDVSLQNSETEEDAPFGHFTDLEENGKPVTSDAESRTCFEGGDPCSTEPRNVFPVDTSSALVDQRTRSDPEKDASESEISVSDLDDLLEDVEVGMQETGVMSSCGERKSRIGEETERRTKSDSSESNEDIDLEAGLFENDEEFAGALDKINLDDHIIPERDEGELSFSIPSTKTPVRTDKDHVHAYIEDLLQDFARNPPLVLDSMDYSAGPLHLQVFLDQEAKCAGASEEQRMYNHALFEAANEALGEIYSIHNRVEVSRVVGNAIPSLTPSELVQEVKRRVTRAVENPRSRVDDLLKEDAWSIKRSGKDM